MRHYIPQFRRFPVFGREHVRQFLIRLSYYCIITFLTSVLTYRICSIVTGHLICVVIIRLIVCVLFTNVILLGFYFKIPEFKQCVMLADHMTKQRLLFIHKLAVRYEQEEKHYVR